MEDKPSTPFLETISYSANRFQEFLNCELFTCVRVLAESAGIVYYDEIAVRQME
jgi:hypothetical protein